MQEHTTGYHTCQICISDRRLEIDREILKGRSYASIGRMFQVTAKSVANHASLHLSTQLMASKRFSDALSSDQLIEDFNFLMSKTKSLLAQAEERGWINSALNAVAQLRSSWESWVRIGGSILALQEAQRLKEAEEERRELEQLDRQSLEVLQAVLSGKLADWDTSEFGLLQRILYRELPDRLVSIKLLPYPEPKKGEDELVEFGPDSDELLDCITFQGNPGQEVPPWNREDSPGPKLPVKVRKRLV